MTAASRWVFGYASLMWDPGFDYLEAQPAHVFGYHRSLCVYSYLYRGTHQKPGIVAGMLPRGSCRGLAFRIALENWTEVEKYLIDREMVYGVYAPKWMKAKIETRFERVFGFVADPKSPQFAGIQSVDRLAKLVKGGNGLSGSGIDYLQKTVAGLHKLGIRDRKLERVLEMASGRR